MKRLLPLLATTTLTLSLVACTDDSPEETPAPAPTVAASTLVPGACIATNGTPTLLGDVDVTEEAIVACEDPHVYEVLAVQDLPGEYLQGTTATDEDRERLQAALDGSRNDAVQMKFAAFARAYCAIGLQRATGLTDLEMAATDAANLLATPITRTSSTRAVLPPQGWTEQPLLICVNRFTEPSPAPESAPAVQVSGLVTPQLLTDEVPVEQRLCLNFDVNGAPADATCAADHDAEYTVTFDATGLLEPEQLAASVGDLSVPFPTDVQEQLDEACTDALTRVIGEDRDEDLVGRALRGGEGWGSGSTTNAVDCVVTPDDAAGFLLPAGSVIGIGDADVELVPRS